jgi:hypothetical protein
MLRSSVARDGDLARFLEAQPFVFAVFTHDDVRVAADAPKTATPARRHTKYVP